MRPYASVEKVLFESVPRFHGRQRAGRSVADSQGYGFESLRQLFGLEDWNIGVVDQPAADIVRRGLRAPVRWLAKPRWRMFADPACRIRPDGGFTLFAESMDHRVGRGEIWTAELGAGADPVRAEFRPLFVAPVHMSYPFPFIDDGGGACLTAETWEAGEALLWREIGGEWRCAEPLFRGRPVVDPTLWRGPDRWWLFCTFADDAPNAHLHIFHAATLDEPWQPHPANPVKTDPRSSRPAGPIFVVDDVLIRPAQDCSRTYGGAVVLNAVRRLDLDGFAEEPCRRLDPPGGPFPHGLHTFCPAGEATVIDGKRWRFHPLELLRKSQVSRGARARQKQLTRRMIAPAVAAR